MFIDTALRYHLCLPDPDSLDDWEWAGTYAYLLRIIEAEKA